MGWNYSFMPSCNVKAWASNYISEKTMYAITYSHPNFGKAVGMRHFLSQKTVSKRHPFARRKRMMLPLHYQHFKCQKFATKIPTPLYLLIFFLENGIPDGFSSKTENDHSPDAYVAGRLFNDLCWGQLHVFYDLPECPPSSIRYQAGGG